jgi:hypothetical protein
MFAVILLQKGTFPASGEHKDMGQRTPYGTSLSPSTLGSARRRKIIMLPNMVICEPLVGSAT